MPQRQGSELAKPRALSRMGKICAQILCFFRRTSGSARFRDIAIGRSNFTRRRL